MPTLSQQSLERHLWQAADILRGTVDAGDYKQYIFGLLFYKRLCDVWDEEYEILLAETGDREEAADPDEHRFHMRDIAILRNDLKEAHVPHRRVRSLGNGRGRVLPVERWKAFERSRRACSRSDIAVI